MKQKIREKCKNCHEKIKNPKIGKIFCSDKCRAVWHGRQEYKEKKDNKEYKLKAKLRHQKWREENRDQFNKLCRDSRVRGKKK